MSLDVVKLKKKLIFTGTIALLFLAAIFVSYLRILDNYELETLDIRFRLRPTLSINKNIVIIEVGDDTIDAIGQWPIPRGYHATLINALTKAGVHSIVFDVFFSEESNVEQDARFEGAIKKSNRVYLPYVFNIAQRGGHDVPVADKLQEALIDKFKKWAKGTGFINIIPDSDGKFRRIPPLIRYRDKLYPHIAFLLCADYFGLSADDMKVKPGRYVELGDVLKVPLDSNSNIIVNFPGKWNKTFRHYSYIDILNSYISGEFPSILKKKPPVDLNLLKDTVCFIGVTATATPDAHPSPYDSLYPGVGVHASVFNSFLIKKFINRASRIVNVVILILLCFIICCVAKNVRTLTGFAFVFFFILAYVILTIALFMVWGLWLDMFCPVAIMLLVYLGLTFIKYINETHKIELLERELSIAQKIQESFLPKESPKVPGIEVAAKMKTAKQVGGDLYDFVMPKEKRLGIMIGDVSGKGMPAALYMAKAVSEFKSYIGEDIASRTIKKLNTQLCGESGSGLFVTLSYMVFKTDEGILNYSTGGHLPMVMLSPPSDKEKDVKVRLVDLKEGMPLGLFDGDFIDDNIHYKKGDMFVLYTDGVTEAMNTKGDMFGEERLVELTKKYYGRSSGEVVEAIQDAVKDFEGKKKQHDDITVVVVRVI